MTACEVGSRQSFFCPTKWQLWRQILSLLPRGRAWQTHIEFVERWPDSGPPAQLGLYELGETGLGYEPAVERLTVMQQFWAAYAEVLEFLHQRACALIEEFFCSTVHELRDEWMVEYGFPDPCDPYASLCDKVRAQGGATCAYLAELAAARGWMLTCSECSAERHAVAGCASAGCAKTCGCPANTIWVTVHLDRSPAYQPALRRYARAGLARAGSAAASRCPVEAEPLQCLIERFKPAHVRAVYIYEGNE